MLWTKWIVVGVVVLILGGLGIREWRASQIVGHAPHRFNLALIVPASGITFVSFDPTEKSVLALPFPPDLSIRSRSSGEYSIASLYKLGSYDGKGGMFARQKIQGFMRIPIPGYIVVNSKKGTKIRNELLQGLWQSMWLFKRGDSSLSLLDSALLILRVSQYSWREVSEDELTRAGVIENNIYHRERLQEFVGSKFFDWGIGGDEITVAVLNGSGENGLGSDMADFLKNLGFDVVMVRSISVGEPYATSEWSIAPEANVSQLSDVFEQVFGFAAPKIGVEPEYRAQIVITVGQDAKELF